MTMTMTTENDENISKVVGDMIRIERKRQGLTMLQLAKRLGSKNHNMVHRLEYAELNPSIRTIQGVARALGYDVAITFKKRK